jgi:hypothetical protein
VEALDGRKPGRHQRAGAGRRGTLLLLERSKLFVFSPSFGADDSDKGLCLKDQVATRTAYRTGGVLRTASACAGADATLVVTAGQQILLHGRKGIGLGRGFSVQRGASLLARTDL